MERLTKRNSSGEIDRACPLYGGERGRCYSCKKRTACNAAIMERLAELEDKLENKTAFELPCPLGGTLWRICNHNTKKPSYFVRSVVLNMNNFYRVVVKGEFGKTVFLTKEEAEDIAEELNYENRNS